MPDTPYMFSGQVAKTLGVSQTTVYKLLASGALKAHRAQNGWFLFDRKSVMEELARRKTRQPAQQTTQQHTTANANDMLISKAAELLGTSYRVVYHLFRSGVIKGRRTPSGLILVDRHSVMEELERRTEWYTPKEAAALLGVPLRHVYYLIRAKKLRAFKYPGLRASYRIHPDAISAYLRTSEAPRAKPDIP